MLRDAQTTIGNESYHIFRWKRCNGVIYHALLPGGNARDKSRHYIFL